MVRLHVELVVRSFAQLLLAQNLSRGSFFCDIQRLEDNVYHPSACTSNAYGRLLNDRPYRSLTTVPISLRLVAINHQVTETAANGFKKPAAGGGQCPCVDIV